ncbi:hypothetical protein [Nocardia fusca]|uniref:Uncharacterized protein n=1 Tax=Nocardia fusca TaxID=941183 RepID=A0ABV3FK79_9NOCA
MKENRIRTEPHDWRIDEREYRRQDNHPGRRFAYPDLDPRRTALVVIDMVPFHVAGNVYSRGVLPESPDPADIDVDDTPNRQTTPTGNVRMGTTSRRGSLNVEVKPLA